jgi:hypothetical protein
MKGSTSLNLTVLNLVISPKGLRATSMRLASANQRLSCAGRRRKIQAQGELNMAQSTHHSLRLNHATLLPKSTVLWIIVLTAIALAAPSQAQQLPNLAGTYRCEPEPSPCQNGQTFTVSQSGNKLNFKDEKGDVGEGTITSNISISAGPTWNMLGTILRDNAIQWSNGTQWHKRG